MLTQSSHAARPQASAVSKSRVAAAITALLCSYVPASSARANTAQLGERW